MKDFAVTITPRLYETDAMGHINNATIAAWFEVVRVRFMESITGADPAAGKNWILAAIQIDFLGETFYGADVTAKITGVTVGNTSVTLEAQMFQGERQTMRGSAVMVYLDYANKKPQPVPADYRQALRSALD